LAGKASTVLRGPMTEVWKVLLEWHKNGMDQSHNYREVVSQSANSETIYAQYAMAPPFTARDFVWECIYGEEENKCYVATINADYPKQKNFIRGYIYLSGFLVRPLNSDPLQCELITISHAHPQGKIPEWLIKPGMDQTYNRLQTISKLAGYSIVK
jgi:hypothetical protein